MVLLSGKKKSSKEPMFCTERTSLLGKRSNQIINNEMLGEEIMINSSLIIIKGDPLTVLYYSPLL